ncbi:MAG: ABC transporter permease subunit [Caldilineaceae bacterium]
MAAKTEVGIKSEPPRLSSKPVARKWFASARDRQTTLALTLMALPGVLMLLVFAYLPMIGLVIAFKNYKFEQGMLGSAWVGLDNFRFLFGTDQAWRITRNTLLMNSLFIVSGTVVALTIAILMNEIYTSFMSKFYQTMLFFPHFISWVIVSYFVFGFLGGEGGLVNKLLVSLGMQSIAWYRSPQYWPAVLTVANLWNGIGFGSIVYLAGILGIDPTYFEAAKIDGASKWQQIRYITLPLLLPLVIILVLLSIGRIFNADFGLFYFVPRNNPQLYPTTDVIDTFVYRSLVQLGDISMAAAAGFYQSVVGFVLVVLANWTVRKINQDYSLF